MKQDGIMYHHWYNVLSGMDGWMDGWVDEWARMTRTERECVPSENVAKNTTIRQPRPSHIILHLSTLLLTLSLSPQMFIHRHVQEQQ